MNVHGYWMMNASVQMSHGHIGRVGFGRTVLSVIYICVQIVVGLKYGLKTTASESVQIHQLRMSI